MRSTDKNEWLFLAVTNSFASSTQGIVSPPAEKLCDSLGKENREAATRKSDSKSETAEKGVKLEGSLNGLSASKEK